MGGRNSAIFETSDILTYKLYKCTAHNFEDIYRGNCLLLNFGLRLEIRAYNKSITIQLIKHAFLNSIKTYFVS